MTASRAVQQPPACNTGAENRSASGSLEFAPIVDYLAWTVQPRLTDRQQLDAQTLHAEACLWLDVLGGGTIASAGLHGYTHGYTCLGGHGRILFNPDRLDMGVHVILPGSALALLEDYSYTRRSEDDPAAGGRITLCPDTLIQLVLDSGGKFSRVDVCQDTDRITLADLRAALFSDHLVTKSRIIRHVVGYTRLSDECPWSEEGGTLYVGARTSQRMVRFYDKAVEQGIKDATWTRCEVEFKSRSAQVAAQHLAAGGSVADLIVSVVDFRELDKVEIEDRSRCGWWHDWIGVAARVSFAGRKLQQSVEQALAWVERAVAPTLAMLSIAGVEMKELLYRLTDRGFARLDASRRLRAIAYRDSGYSLIPAAAPDLSEVFTDFQAWVFNRAFDSSVEVAS